MKPWRGFAFLPLMVLASISSAANITYDVNQTVGAGSVTGSLITDGATGTIANTDVLSWNLVLNDGSTTFDLTNANSNLTYTQLTATSTQLSYNYAGAQTSSLPPDFAIFTNASTTASETGWCLQAKFGQCTQLGATGNFLVINGNVQSGLVGQFTTVTGLQVFASVSSVPEPENGATMLVGLALLAIAWRRRSGGVR